MRLSCFIRLLVAACALTYSGSASVAAELEAAESLVEKVADDIFDVPKPPIEVDFDIEAKASQLDEEDKQGSDDRASSEVSSDASRHTDVESEAAKAAIPHVEVGFNSFSSAFTSALHSIQEQDASARPTPARSGSVNSVLGMLQDAVQEDESKTSERPRPRVAVTGKSQLRSPLQLELKPESIEPRVAGPIVKTPRKKILRPLTVELDQFLDEVEAKPAPTSSAKIRKATPKVLLEDPVVSKPVESAPATAEVPPSQVEAPKRRPIPPREPNVRITQRMAQLQPRVAKTLRTYFNRPLNTADDSAWSVMHSMLGYGPNGQVAINGPRGRRTNVVHWLCQNGICANRRLLYIDGGYIKGLEGPGFQGHPGQFLAMLAQIGTEREFPLNVQGKRLTVDALVNSEMYTCSSRKELTFKLISLSYYLDSEATWMSENGETWDLPKILAIEMAQPVNGAACGGTHRIMSIACAVRNRWLRGEPIDGVYAQAQRYVRQYQQYAMSLQNRDGSFSTEWFKRPASSKDKDRQLQTTGHILEWMVYTLPRNELSDPRIVKAVEFLTNLMSRGRFRDWEVGPRGHAIRALSLYHQRVFERQGATPRMVNAELWSSVLR